MTPIKQTLFGSPDGPVDQIGNCYPACLATLLDLPLEQIPHVHQLHKEPEDALSETLQFLLPRGFTSLIFDYAPWLQRYAPGALVILSGKSPRGDWSHAVVGEITPTGWRLVHDPHPSDAGIVGEPTHAELVFPILRGAA